VSFDAVKASLKYGLESSYDHVWSGFSAYRNGKETILAYQASAKDGAPDGWNSNWGERLNFRTVGTTTSRAADSTSRPSI